MNTVLVPLALTCVAPLLAGCAASAAARAATTDAAYAASERQVFGDLERQEFAKALQVRLPAKLAVTDVTEDAWEDVRDDTNARRLVQAVHGLGEDTTTYVDVVSVPADAVARPNTQGDRVLEALRGVAAGHQADLQLVIARREHVHADTNALAIFKLLILPMLFLPTEEDRMTLTVRAMVRDVRNGLVYTTYDDHREAVITVPLVSEDAAVRRGQDTLYDDVVRDMRESLGRKLPALERESR